MCGARQCNCEQEVHEEESVGRLSQVTLDILVEALGRVNFGCVWDFKGLTSPVVTLNGNILCCAHSFSLCHLEMSFFIPCSPSHVTLHCQPCA